MRPHGWRERLTTPQDAVGLVRPGDRVFVGTGCATPCTLLRALEDATGRPAGVQLLHVVLSGALPPSYAEGRSHYRHRALFVGTGDVGLIRSGRAEYVPVSLADVPGLLRTRRMPVDVALVQVSPPDDEGMCSLGISVDVERAAIDVADRVIAEVNPRMPRVGGDPGIDVAALTALVEVDEELAELEHPRMDAAGERIARYVARIISDGSTLQIGLGRVPNEMLRFLSNRRDLGVHSDVITDPVVDLVEGGVVTGARKSADRGIVVASWAMGTRRLYDLLDRDPRFELRPIDAVCAPDVIAHQAQMVSVTQAFAVDLTGQVCADELEGELYGGVATQPDFHRGAVRSPGGKAIVCLLARGDDGAPRIRARLRPREGVAIPRSEVHYVVTEYGVAYLFGRSLRQRAVELIEIAHPDDRPALLAEARELGYVPDGQILRSRSAYPTDEERTAVLRDGRTTVLRPTRASDADALQALFHALSPGDVYTRFFRNLDALPDPWAQHLCSVDYEHEMAFAAVVGEDWEREEIVATTAYYVDRSTNLADVAIMVRPDWQGAGLGTAILRRTADYARAHHVRGFTADILRENTSMLSVLEHLDGDLSLHADGVVFEAQLTFGR